MVFMRMVPGHMDGVRIAGDIPTTLIFYHIELNVNAVKRLDGAGVLKRPLKNQNGAI
jgi:hypothetical protein